MKLVPESPPPGPFRAGFWRSPLRGPWLTTALGSLLLIAVTVVSVTGFASHLAYMPGLGANAIVDSSRDIGLPFVDLGWPRHPSWLYALNQGLHVTVGIIAIPLLLAKLWSVIPRLFTWPPAATPAEGIERASIGLLVGSALFLFATGVLDAQVYYPFRFNFVVAHYYGAVVFVAALVLHVAIKLPVMRRAYATHGALAPLRDDLAHTRPEPRDPDGLVAESPDAPTLSRRGLFAVVGTGSLALLVSTAGQSIGGPLRKVALLAPRRESFPVNKTAALAKITPKMVGADYALDVRGPKGFSVSRDDLLRMDLVTQSLPIACVEGWSTTQSWTGVRLRDLARMAGAPGRGVTVESLQAKGVLRHATLTPEQVADDRSLLALRVNGADLTMDHGFPARIIVPALPGVHNTKWVAKMTFA